MNCPHGLADPFRCATCCARFPDPIAQGKAARLAHKLATCTHALAELERRKHCTVCGAWREHRAGVRGHAIDSEWQPTKLAEAAIGLDEMFMLAGVQWGPETDDSDEEIVNRAKSGT